MMLHGDLHHWNMLQCSDGQWKAIDPKGVIGLACQEPARYLENQLELAEPKRRLDILDITVTSFGKRLGESKKTIAACAFVDMVLSSCWSVEDNADAPSIDRAVLRCQDFFNYLEQL